MSCSCGCSHSLFIISMIERSTSGFPVSSPAPFLSQAQAGLESGLGKETPNKIFFPFSSNCRKIIFSNQLRCMTQSHIWKGTSRNMSPSVALQLGTCPSSLPCFTNWREIPEEFSDDNPSVPQPLVFISLGNSEQPREKEEHSKPFIYFFFLISFRQAGRCFTGCKSSFVFPFLSEGLFGLSKAWQSWCVNMRGYQKEMKLDCWRVCSFLWQQAAWEACHSRHLNRLGVLRPVA